MRERGSSTRARRHALVLSVVALLASCGTAPPAVPEIPSEVVRAGTLRVAVGPSEVPMTGRRVADDETLTGLAPELADELGRRLGVQVAIDGYPSFADLVLRSSRWDVAFVSVDPAFDELEFAVYGETDSVAVVPKESPFAAVSQLDRAGVRIAAVRGSPLERWLSAQLKKASLVRTDDAMAAFSLLESDTVHAFADTRQHLLALAVPIDDRRILDGRFRTTSLAVAVPKARTTLAAYVRLFVREAKTSGLVQRAIERSGLRGVRVAP